MFDSVLCKRAMQAQNAPSPRMVNMCQATQTTIITPNPMLQGALLMQQMQGTIQDEAFCHQNPALMVLALIYRSIYLPLCILCIFNQTVPQ